MQTEGWTTLLAAALVANAVLGVAYRAYRYAKGGPIADVWGQVLLAVVLTGLAIAVANDVMWVRWVALVYAIVFAFVAMPVWILGVLIPLPPRPIDYAFTGLYYVGLIAIAISSVAL
ncbi:MAG TPA: hypothetical protein VFK89_12695 [Actinomycetota bacterium]|nr:hypothetical protein [Actinomycetota bacterium]